MSRAVSLHIGVDHPGGRFSGRPLQHSESVAWRMAGVAERAGYGSLMVLRGEAATRAAVHDALTWASGLLTAGDTLFVSFSGHGAREPDRDCDDRDRCDEGWCLADGVLIDDRLTAYWRLFERGVRIVVVADCCYGAGSMRGEDEGGVVPPPPARVMRDGGDAGFVLVSAPSRPMRNGGGAGDVVHPAPLRVMRNGTAVRGGPAAPPDPAADLAGSYVVQCPHVTDGIQASLLLLAAAAETQPAREGLFSGHLLDVWNDGAFDGSYSDLYREVRKRLMTEHASQQPQILMLGASDPGFALEPAFRVGRRGGRGSTVYR